LNCCPLLYKELVIEPTEHLLFTVVDSQVRLFAAEDAPDVSGTAHQDLLQAKQTKFMHATVPISPSDLPPGFGVTAPMSMRPAVADVMPWVPWRIPAVVSGLSLIAQSRSSFPKASCLVPIVMMRIA